MFVLVPFVMSVDAESLQLDFVVKLPSCASPLIALRTVVLLL
jgi:hypothetical protein